MDYKRFELPFRAFDNQFLPFNHIQHIDTVPRMVQDFSCKPMAACFNKLIFIVKVFRSLLQMQFFQFLSIIFALPLLSLQMHTFNTRVIDVIIKYFNNLLLFSIFRILMFLLFFVVNKMRGTRRLLVTFSFFLFHFSIFYNQIYFFTLHLFLLLHKIKYILFIYFYLFLKV